MQSGQTFNEQSSVQELQEALARRSLSLRPPPPVPSTCCGRGCNGCVWEGYYNALDYWREQALGLLGAGQG